MIPTGRFTMRPVDVKRSYLWQYESSEDASDHMAMHHVIRPLFPSDHIYWEIKTQARDYPKKFQLDAGDTITIINIRCSNKHMLFDVVASQNPLYQFEEIYYHNEENRR